MRFFRSEQEVVQRPLDLVEIVPLGFNGREYLADVFKAGWEMGYRLRSALANQPVQQRARNRGGDAKSLVDIFPLYSATCFISFVSNT